MKLLVPDNSVFQDTITVRVQGVRPGAIVKLSAQMVDAEGMEWRSCASIFADQQGQLCTGTSASITGTYTGVDVGGLFWSMRPEVMFEGETRVSYCNRVLKSEALPLMPTLSDLKPVNYRLSACDLDSGKQVSASFTRHRTSATTRVERINEGRLRGMAFFPQRAHSHTPTPGVLILGGSEGGLLTERAAALAEEGFVTLVLGYFDYEDRPTSAINLPLEYFAEGLDWLHSHCSSVGIWGSSRGSEAAMLMACHYPELVDSTVAWVPSHVVNTGFEMSKGEHFSDETRAMWSLQDQPITGVPHSKTHYRLAARRQHDASRFPGYSYTPEFLEVWRSIGDEQVYKLPLDRLECPLLLVAGEDDQLWPSSYGAQQIASRLQQRGNSPNVELHCYPDAGHMIGVPNETRPFSDVVCWRDGYSGVDAGLVAYGGTPAGNAAAARDSWRRVNVFFNQSLTKNQLNKGDSVANL